MDTDNLQAHSIHAFIQEQGIKVEQGMPVDFREHFFLYDVYRDFSPKQVILKAAQVGFSTLAVLKSLWLAKNKHVDIIYTLPTDNDRNDFVGGKVNRILAQNSILQSWTQDKDSVEQKRVGNNIIYYRGTWTQKAAIMVPSDVNIYDEVDTSKQDVVEQYSTRLQHSKYKWEWYFSHPSAEGVGVDKFWDRSDQKHWNIKCNHCGVEQYMSWSESVDQEKQVYICKECKGELSEQARAKGRWIPKYKDREFSGYWIPLLICPWVSAKEICSYYEHKSEEYFWNKVLGLPYVGGGNKLTKSLFMQNVTDRVFTPDRDERVVIGVDTGLKLHYVIGTGDGIFYYDEAQEYAEIEEHMARWKRAIVVIDQGGDIIGSRKLREDYPGRVFLCSYGEDRKTKELVRWGRHDEDGAVIADRNRTIQLVVDEFTDRRIPVQGTEDDWYDYWLHWNNLTRIKEESKHGDKIRKVWARSGEDHWAHATVYWRVGVSRFGVGGSVITGKTKPKLKVQRGLDIDAEGKAYVPRPIVVKEGAKKDWRIV